MFSFDEYIKNKNNISRLLAETMIAKNINYLHANVMGNITYKMKEISSSYPIYKELNILVVIPERINLKPMILKYDHIFLNIKFMSKIDFIKLRDKQSIVIFEYLALPDIYIFKKEESLYKDYSFDMDALNQTTEQLIADKMEKARHFMVRGFQDKNTAMTVKAKYMTWQCIKYMMIKDYLKNAYYKNKVTLEVLDENILKLANTLYFVFMDENPFKWTQWMDICKSVIHMEVYEELFKVHLQGKDA